MTKRLLDLPTAELLDKFGAGGHIPGSGSAAAMQGILAARLLQTVIDLTNEPRRAERYASWLPRLLEIKSAVTGRITPHLERLFQDDSDQFATVIQLRKRRQSELDPTAQKRLATEARTALIPATEIPIEIANDCAELARFALDVFDHGFQSALGDAGVALNMAISGASGALSIVELNLQSFDADEWTARIRGSRDILVSELKELTEEARKRLASQIERTERRAVFYSELQSIAVAEKGKRLLSESAIEALAIRLQRTLWSNIDWLWKDGQPKRAFDVLNPDRALECFGFTVHHPTTLGQYMSHGTTFEVAGQIDQSAKMVSISEQFPEETRTFTSAHELGHHLLHTQSVLHRDRPLNGLRVTEPRDTEEWQADKFASYFLMPTKLVKATFGRMFLTQQFRITEQTTFALNERSPQTLREKCGNLRGLARLLAKATSYNGTNFYSLSDRFKVSPEAMAIRLEELKLIIF